MKKIQAALMGLIFALAGCSNNQSKNQTNTPQPPVSNNTTINTPSGNKTAVDTAQAKSFTLDELKKYNGQNGNPAYVAVNGTVYDVGNVEKWQNGFHKVCANAAAGKDLTNFMAASPHGTKILSRVPVVGTLK